MRYDLKSDLNELVADVCERITFQIRMYYSAGYDVYRSVSLRHLGGSCVEPFSRAQYGRSELANGQEHVLWSESGVPSASGYEAAMDFDWLPDADGEYIGDLDDPNNDTFSYYDPSATYAAQWKRFSLDISSSGWLGDEESNPFSVAEPEYVKRQIIALFADQLVLLDGNGTHATTQPICSTCAER